MGRKPQQLDCAWTYCCYCREPGILGCTARLESKLREKLSGEVRGVPCVSGATSSLAERRNVIAMNKITYITPTMVTMRDTDSVVQVRSSASGVQVPWLHDDGRDGSNKRSIGIQRRLRGLHIRQERCWIS